MSANTLAELITDVFQGLGFPPPEYAATEDAARAVVHASALVKQVTGFSSQNLNFKHAKINPSTRDYSLQSVPDVAVPAWIERRIGETQSSNDYWVRVEVCNLANLEDARHRSAARCAFYVEDEILRVKFSYDPEGEEHRIWYSPQTWIAQTLNDVVMGTSTTPTEFWPLIVSLAQMLLIPTMKVRAAMDKTNPASRELISAWNQMEDSLSRLVGPLPNWADRLRHYAHGSRGGSRGRRRRPVLARGY